jgi:hypothetical protein
MKNPDPQWNGSRWEIHDDNIHPDIFIFANTKEAAIEKYKDAIIERQIIEERIRQKFLPVRKSKKQSEKTGKWMQRATPELHTALANLADRRGISLNSLVNQILGEYAAREYSGLQMARNLSAGSIFD